MTYFIHPEEVKKMEESKIDRFTYVGLELEQLSDYLKHTKSDHLFEQDTLFKIGRLIDRAIYIHNVTSEQVRKERVQ